MQSEEESLFSTIHLLIDQKEYVKAEDELNLIIQGGSSSERAVSYAYYLIGYIHTCWDNKAKNKTYAKRMLLACIESNFPISHAYSLYADQEDDKNISLNYLGAGLYKFPESPSIYLSILNHCPKNETIKYIDEIKSKNILNVSLYNKVIEILISISSWEKAESFLDKLLEQNELTEYNKMYYKMLYSFSLVMQNKEIERAKILFQEIIETDLSNDLKYSSYMGYIWCCIKMNLNEEAIKYFDKIPITDSLDDFFEGPWCIIFIDFSCMYKLIFGELMTLLVDDRNRALRLITLEAYYLYIPSENYDNFRYGKRHYSTLKRYYKTDVKNLNIACAIYNMQKHYSLYFDAYKTYIEMLGEYLNPEEKFIDGIDFLDECSEEEINLIYRDIINTIDSLDLDFNRFVSGIFDNIVDNLYESKDEEKYKKIVSLAEKIKYKYLEKSKEIFDVAYSYAVLDEKSKVAEQLYLYLLKKQPDNNAVLNNLGVIYEKRNEFYKAKEFFKRAYELRHEKKYSDNINRVSSIIKENEKALISIQQENTWFLGRLSRVYEASDTSGELICTYKNRSTILDVSPNKADDIFEQMCERKYLIKISGGNYQSPSKYQINPLIKEYLLKMNERIQANKVYEYLAEKLNIDEIEKIGYNKDLQDLINNITNPDLKEVLSRDIRECAISLLTNQYKSCIVICGSIIEAILVDRIEDSGIKRYDIGTLLNKKIKTKSVKEMDLNELIELAKAERIINIEGYHLTNYIRYYRNIIHPSCEVRRNNTVNEEKAKLTWIVLLEIINGLLK